MDGAAPGTEVDKIAETVLYEGYLLWPYRRSTKKNQKRWTFGGVYPRIYSESPAGVADPWQIQTQCLVQTNGLASDAEPSLDVRVRFLQRVERQVARCGEDGQREFVDELQVGADRYLSWDEAIERDVTLTGLKLADLPPFNRPISIPADNSSEPLFFEGGADAGDAAPAGWIERNWQSIDGLIEVESEAIDGGLIRLTLRISNTGSYTGEAGSYNRQDREAALGHTMLSTHAILTLSGGEFISMVDAPAGCQEAVSACRNLHLWPVLAGKEGDRHTMLASPIILYDYPQIAPESPGDLFDATEIDKLLVLNVLSLTDDEKNEMRASDPRAREILERSEALTNEELMRLNGAIREFRMLRPEAENDLFEGWAPSKPTSVMIDGEVIVKGSRVRLRPRPGGDIMDLALAGEMAIVESIEQDDADEIHLTVTVEKDPGRDLGAASVLGHRFFFRPEEIEPAPDDGR